MKYFLDCEFINVPQENAVYLLSIALVCDDGREFYAINGDCPMWRADAWVKANVIAQLPVNSNPQHWSMPWAFYTSIRAEVLAFIGDDPEPEFWGDYCAYDYVVFSHLIGTLDDWPRHWPFYFNDLQQMAASLPQARLVPQPTAGQHHALVDARWVKAQYQALLSATELAE